MKPYGTTRKRVTALTALTIACLTALPACSTSAPADVAGLRAVVGTQLAGAIGRTEADQLRIDRTVARLCGGNVWQRAECDRHTASVQEAYRIPPP